MEVHHHPVVEKKGIKEYLLEGLMIFLAVSMGFIAENIREHVSEKKIEDTYIRSFVADLAQDTAEFNRVIPTEIQAVKGLDTMLHLLDTYQQSDSTDKLLYYLFRRYTLSIEGMGYTQRTVTQLKSTGGLRLIGDNQASDNIITYSKAADDDIELFKIAEHDFMVPAFHLGNKIFNASFLLPYDNGNAARSIISLHTPTPLLTKDALLLKEYQGKFYGIRQIRINYLHQLQFHVERAKDMIQFFTKAYDLY